MAIENYVKFLRGTPAAFKLLAEKNKDTLYFISEKDSDFWTLYLGDRIVARSGESEKTTLDSLKDVVINKSLEDGSLLVYDANLDSWINLPIAEVIKQSEEQDFSWIKEIADTALEEARAAKQEVDVLKEYVDERTIIDENRLWSEDDRNIFSNITSENYVNNNEAIKLLDAGNSPIKNLVVTAKEKTDKVYLTICGKNIANINTKVENTPSLSGGAVLPAILPFTLGDFSGEISSSILPQYLPFVLNVNKNSDNNKTNNILLPIGKIILYINEGYKFSVDLLKNNTIILRKNLITELLIDNSDNKYDEMQVSFDSDDIDKIKFMAEIGETATGYEPYKGYSVVYENSFAAGEIIDLTDELQNFNTFYGVTNVISNCNVSFDYNQLKETSTDGWLYSRGGKVITTLATTKEDGLMSSEDKKKLDSFAPATDAEFAEMMASLDLIDVLGVDGSVLTDNFDNVISL